MAIDPYGSLADSLHSGIWGGGGGVGIKKVKRAIPQYLRTKIQNEGLGTRDYMYNAKSPPPFLGPIYT